jgi:class 3 adenylate cyclase
VKAIRCDDGMADSSQLTERLARRVAARLPDAAEALRRGEGARMLRQTMTLLYVDMPAGGDGERVGAEVAWLAARHGGSVDPFAERCLLVAFDHPTAGVDMALDLQQATLESRLRITVTTTSCLRMRFAHAGREFETVLGAEDDLVARAGNGAGGIRLSPSTYALVRDCLQEDDTGTLGLETEPAPLHGGLDFDLGTPAALERERPGS